MSGKDFVRTIPVVLAALALVPALGCSTSYFSGDPAKMDGRGSNTGSTAINKECMGLDLSSEAFTVPVLRSLVNCLSSNGSIPAYRALVAKATDAQLGAILDVMNRDLALNKPRLKALNASFLQYESKGTLSHLYSQLNTQLADPALFVAGAHLLRQAAVDGDKIDAGVLALLRLVAVEADAAPGPRENTRKLLEGWLQFTGLRSYDALVESLKLPISPGRPALKILAAKALEYAQEKIVSEAPLGRVAAESIADGTLLAALDHFYFGKLAAPALLEEPLPVAPPAKATGKRPKKPAPVKKPVAVKPGAKPVVVVRDRSQLDRQIPAISDFMEFTMAEHKEDVLRRSATMFRELDMPVSCLDGTKQIPNAMMYMFDELLARAPEDAPYWLLRTNTLKLKSGASMCDFPKGLDDMIRSVEIMAKEDGGRELVTLVKLIHSLHAAEALPAAAKNAGKHPTGERFRRLLIDWIGDRGEASLVSNLADGIGELSRHDRGSVIQSLYLLESGDNRETLRRATRFLVRERSATDMGLAWPLDTSAYDTVSRATLRLKSDTFADFASAVRDRIDSGKGSDALFQVAREMLLGNDANPLLEIAMDVARNAEANEPAIRALIELAELPEFAEALRLTATMAGDGSLHELLKGMLDLYSRSARDVQASDPNLLEIKRLEPIADEKQFTVPAIPVARLSAVAKLPVSMERLDACSEMDVGVGLADTSDRRWSAELVKLGACVNTAGRYDKFEDFLKYGVSRETSVTGDKTLLRFLVDLITDLFRMDDKAARRKALDEAGDILTDAGSYNDVRNAQDLSTYLFSQSYCTAKATDRCSGADRLAPAQAVFRVCSILRRDPALPDLLDLAATVTDQKEFPRALRHVRDVLKDNGVGRPQEALRPEFSRSVLAQMRKLIRDNYAPNDRDVEAMTTEAVRKFWLQQQSGKENLNYRSASELKAAMGPMLDELSSGKRPVLANALKFFKRFKTNPYDPAWWDGWFHRLASKVRAIPYYYPGTYPGSDKPAMRFVTQLDLLELVVIDADFTLNELGQFGGRVFENPNENFAIRYLGWLANTGDDLDGWVARLKADLDKYYDMAFDSLIVKKAMEPELKRRLFNLRQIFPLLPELNAQVDTAVQPDTGRTVVRNDLGLLRDLFRDVLDATPPGQQATYTKSANSLALIVELTHFGILRAASTLVWGFDTEIRPISIEPLLRFLRDSVVGGKLDSDGLNADVRAELSYLLIEDGKPYGSFDNRYPTVGAIIDKIFEWTAGDSAAGTGEVLRDPRRLTILRNSAYSVMELLDGADNRYRTRRGADLIPQLVTVLRPYLATEQGTNFVRKNLRWLDSAAKDSDAAAVLARLAHPGKSAYQGSDALSDLIGTAIAELARDHGKLSRRTLDLAERLLDDSEGRLESMLNVLGNLGRDSSYKKLKTRSLDASLDRLFRWYSNVSGESRLAPRLQHFTAERLRNGDVRALIDMIGRESEGSRDAFYDHVKFLGDRTYVDGARDALEVLRTGIRDVAR